MVRRIGLSVALGLLFAASAAAAPVDTPGSQRLVAHMHEHFNSATQIKSAIIRGDLAAIRQPARWLAEHPAPADMPADWIPPIEAMRSAARAAFAATNFKSAAAATSQMATACGNCHVVNEISGQFPWLAEPADDIGDVAHMRRHQWAADRMWEGLIGPSDDAWSDGTGLLLEAPLSAQKLSTEDQSHDSIRTMARRVHELAANGTVEYGAAGRAAIYAEFLATCAACHTHVQQGPAD